MNKIEYEDWLHLSSDRKRLSMNQAAWRRLGGCRRVVIDIDGRLGWVKLSPRPDRVGGSQLVVNNNGSHHLVLKANQQFLLQKYFRMVSAGGEAYFVGDSNGKYWYRPGKEPEVGESHDYR